MSREEFSRRVREDKAASLTAAALEAEERQKQEHLIREQELKRPLGEGK